MKMKFLAIGLLSAVMATSVVFADDTSATSATTATTGVSGQQAPDTSATTNGAMSGTGQMSQ